MGSFIVGLDLGQAVDYTALVVAEKIERRTYDPAKVFQATETVTVGAEWGGMARSMFPARTEQVHREMILNDDGSTSPLPADGEPSFDVRHIKRWKRGTPYPTIVDDVVDLMSREPLKTNGTLVIDSTGVGRAVTDMFSHHPKRQFSFARVVITAGDASRYDMETGYWHVPKRDLVSVVQVLLQSRRLRFPEASKIPEVATLVTELGTFQTKITAAANDVYGAWREGAHDDLVLALSMALWHAQHAQVRVRWLG